MTHGSAAQPDEGQPWIRNQDFVDYLDRQIAAEKAAGGTITELAERGGMSRQQFNRWRGIGGPQSIPETENLIEFCVRNKWPLEEPFRILGWGTPFAPKSRRQSLVDKMQLVVETLDDDVFDDDDLDEVEGQFEVIAQYLQARSRRRRQKDQ